MEPIRPWNHVDTTPSPEDIAVTKRLVQAGEILGIVLLEHLIVGDSGYAV